MTAAATLGVHCCECRRVVPAELVGGREVYPGRHEFYSHDFWRCPTCLNYVGCHRLSSDDPLRPLGSIPGPELRAARRAIHARLDPLWRGRRGMRSLLYALLSRELGREYHTGDLGDMDEVALVHRALDRLQRRRIGVDSSERRH